MGLPTIVNSDVGDLDVLFANNRVGHCINSFSEKDYSEAVDSVESLVGLSKESISKVAKENFSLNSGIESYQSIYSKLLKNT